MAKKKEAGSRLLKALGKTKKEQMKVLYPKLKSKVRGKGPYVRGTIGKKGADAFQARRRIMAGTGEAFRQTKKKGIGIADVVGAGAAGFAVGKGWHKKLAGAVTKAVKKKDRPSHQDKAREAAEKGIKKQKAKKEKRKSHH